jgi:aminomethyltransferase
MSQTALYDQHVSLGASFTDFGGWQMPVRYSSDLAEHHSVRNAAGLFDISHMAEIFISGHDAARFLDLSLVGTASAIRLGKAKYSLICNESGGIIDDLIVYRLAETEYLIIANAGNRISVREALEARADAFEVSINDASDDYGLLAIQGPSAKEILQLLTETDLSKLSYYSIAPALINTIEVFICRTGYTGEDGFELLVRNSAVTELWQLLLHTGKSYDLVPAGLACRDTLRLEAGMPLYGHELNQDVNPFEAGLGKVVKFDRSDVFVGRSALEPLADSSVNRKLVGLVGEGKRAARADYEIYSNDESQEVVGAITSGVLSPTLGFPIAMAFVEAKYSEPDTKLSVDVRGTRLQMTVVPLPLYSRNK